MPPLSILIWLPAACGVLGAILSTFLDRGRATATTASEPDAHTGTWSLPGVLALIGTVIALGLAIGYIADYKPGTSGLQHVTDVVWISELGIHYKLGISGLNVFLIGLTTLLFAAATIAANLRIQSPSTPRPKLFWLFFMIAESAVLGALLAQDLALFVAFFDLMLIPFYFLTLFGGPTARGTREERVKATIKLVVYTLVGSLLMLAAAIATGVLAAQQGGGHITFVLSQLQALPLSKGSQEWIFLFFAAAFLVKMPAFPLHGWMPDGYRAMPIEVLMVFSGVLSKVGAYGFLAIVLPLFPQAAVHFQTLMLVIALVSILYGSAVAFTQTDARLILGYSSVAQLGFITLGIFALNPQGAQGALLQMVNHGLVVAPLLFIIALLAQRSGGSEDIRAMGGIAFRAPVLASIFLIVSLATLAMPGSSNFVGEFMILLGVFQTKLAIAIIAFTGVVMASVYALRLFIRAMHNRVGKDVDSRDMTIRDGLVLVPIVAVIVFMAIYPQLALRRSEGAVKTAVASAHAALSPTPAGALASSPSRAIAVNSQEAASGESHEGASSEARSTETTSGAGEGAYRREGSAEAGAQGSGATSSEHASGEASGQENSKPVAKSEGHLK
jgi:NADH-quinone oxidoreductase subunit M